MTLYWTLWVSDLLISCSAIYFFITGFPRIGKRSYYYLNWVSIICWLFVVLGGSLYLYEHMYFQWAYFLLLSIFVPAVLGLLFALAIIYFNSGRWN